MTLGELKKTLSEASQVFILTDENVAMFWLPETEHWLGCEHAVEIVLKPGEKYKTLQTAQRISPVFEPCGPGNPVTVRNFGTINLYLHALDLV